jgi:hypothetical protein
MHDADLHLEPNEASDLAPLSHTAMLERQGWGRAYATVLDEAPVEQAIAILGHAAGADLGEGWEAHRVDAKPTARAGGTEDAEACCARDGRLYVIGSQFGSKDGPLQAKRSFLGRLTEKALAKWLDDGKRPTLEVAWLRFGLHRAVNDALADAHIQLLELGPRSRELYIDATIAEGARREKAWAGRVRSSDHPINVEGAEFRANGNLLLGLRYPVSAAGRPLLVELEDVDALFEDADAVPRCTHVWTLAVGSRTAPLGVRALHTDGPDSFHAVVGNLDSMGKGAAILEDHPAGGKALSTHVRFELPMAAGGGDVEVEVVHRFRDLRRVEGLAIDADGAAHYVVDRDGHVALRTLVLS